MSLQAMSMSKTIKPSDWITPDETPDPSPLPRVVGWSILIRPQSVVNKTKGGLVLPDVLMDDLSRAHTVGRVLAMGSLCYTHPDFRGERFCNVGDIISYPKLAGVKYKFKGVNLILLDEKDVNMVLADAKDIDANYNLAHYTT